MFKRKKQKQYVNSYFKPVTSMKVDNIIKQAIPPDNPPDTPPNKPSSSGISDSEGLQRAYNAPNSVFIDGNRMFISGTHTGKDVYDWKLIPLGLVKYSSRYQEADAALKDNPQVDTVIGHSLGSSVAAELNRQYNNKFDARYYGSPFVDFSFSRDPKNQRFRHPGDIVSMFDTGAFNEDSKTHYQFMNPHSYEGFNNPDNIDPPLIEPAPKGVVGSSNEPSNIKVNN